MQPGTTKYSSRQIEGQNIGLSFIKLDGGGGNGSETWSFIQSLPVLAFIAYLALIFHVAAKIIIIKIIK